MLLARVNDMSWTSLEESFMTRAIEVAERGRGRVRPNPLVGCVLVKDGQIIAEGWHDHLGGLHAEQMAIHDAEERGHSPNGSTAYVTLEPCNHFGRTPPCTESLMWAGVKEVIVAHRDPNPKVRGSGISVLEKAGISVRYGLMEEQAAHQMQSFLHWCEHMRPMVTFKVAVDANNCVDDLSVESKRFTSDASLDNVHHLRNEMDAVIVGVGTVVRDDPRLDVRRVQVGHGGQPLRVVLDSMASIPPESNLLNDGGKTLVFHGTEMQAPWAIKRALNDGIINLKGVMDYLGDMDFQEVLLEGGPTTARLFLDAGLVDRVIHIRADVEFTDGVPLGITLDDFVESGLEMVKEMNWGGDSVQCWSRDGLPWPSDNWPLPMIVEE